MFKKVIKNIENYKRYLILITIGIVLIIIGATSINSAQAGCWDCTIHLIDPGCPDPGYFECSVRGDQYDYGTFWIGRTVAGPNGGSDLHHYSSCNFIDSPAKYSSPINHGCYTNPDQVYGDCYATQNGGAACPAPTNLTAQCTQGNPPQIRLQWSDDLSPNGPTGFDIEIGGTGNANIPNNPPFMQNGTYYYTTDGTSAGTYGWKVTSVNSNGIRSSTIWSSSNFSCPAACPTSSSFGTPSNLSPSSALSSSTTTVTLTWTNASGATTAHNVRLRDNTTNPTGSTCGSDIYCWDNATSGSINPPVTAGHSYTWWVDAVDVVSGCTPPAAHTASVDFSINPVSVPGFDFTSSSGGNKSVVAGNSVTNNIWLTLSAGSAQTVTLTPPANDAANKITYSLNTRSCTPGSSCTSGSPAVLTMTTTSSTPIGNYTVTVGAAGGGQSHPTQFTLTVRQPSSFGFSLTNGGDKSANQGIQGSNNIVVTMNSGTTAEVVTLRTPNTSSGVTYSFSPTSSTSTTTCTPNSGTPLTCNVTLYMNVASSATAGPRSVTVTGTSPTVTTAESTNFTLNVTAPPAAFTQNNPAPTCSGTSARVVLSWGTSTGATSYQIWRKLGTSGTPSNIGTPTPATGTSFTDTTPLTSNQYCYLIKAINASGTTDSDTSTYKCTTTSSCATVVTPPTVDIKAAPSGGGASDGPITIANNSTATISWTTTSCTSANNCVCNASNAWSGSKNISGSGASPFTTSPLAGPAQLIYALSCVNDGGSSTDSVTVNVNAPAGSACTAPNSCITTGTQGASCTVQSGTCVAGRTCYSCPAASSFGSWIQTVGGDVHSNTYINTPGGP